MTERVCFEVCVYGKLVQSPGGAIVPHNEHDICGRSPDFPRDLMACCTPAQVSIGEPPLFQWEKFPWLRDGGGIVVKPVSTGNESFVLVARVLGRLENPANPLSRRYIQAIYLACPAREFSPRILSTLVEQLFAEPLTKIDNARPRVEFLSETLDAPLSVTWLEEIASALEIVVSGESIFVQDPHVSLQTSAERAAAFLTCLPASVAWRIPIGVGLVTPKANVAFGIGSSSEGAKIDAFRGVIRGTEGVDLSSGRRYVAWLRSACASCRTLRDVQAIVEKSFAGHRALDTQTTWQSATRQLAERLADNEALVELESWFKNRGPRPSLNMGRLRPDAIRLVVDNLSGGGVELLGALSDSAWRDAWEEVGREASSSQKLTRAIGVYIGHLPIPFSPSSLAVLTSVEFPKEVWGRGNTLLYNALQLYSGNGREWIWLAEPNPQHPEWVRNLRARVELPLFLLALRDRYSETPQDLFQAIGDMPFVISCSKVFDGTCDDTTLDRFIKWISPAPESLMTLLANDFYATNKRALACCALRDAMSRTAGSSGDWIVSFIAERERDQSLTEFTVQLALELSASRWELSFSMVVLILRSLTELPEEVRKSGLLERLAASIGNTMSTILLGLPTPNATGKHSRAAEDFAIAWLVKDPYRASPLVQACALGPAVDDEVRRRLLNEWAKGQPLDKSKRPDLSILRGILRGVWESQETAPGDPAITCLQRLLTVHPSLFKPECVRTVNTLLDLKIYLEVVPKGSKHPIPSALTTELILACVEDRGRCQRWAQRIRLAQVESLDGFRAVNRLAEPTRRDEMDLLILSDSEFENRGIFPHVLVSFANHGITITPERLDRVRGNQIAILSTDDLEILVEVALEVRAQGLLEQIGAEALRRSCASGIPLTDVEEAMFPSLISRWLEKLVGPPPPNDKTLRVAQRSLKYSDKDRKKQILAPIGPWK